MLQVRTHVIRHSAQLNDVDQLLLYIKKWWFSCIEGGKTTTNILSNEFKWLDIWFLFGALSTIRMQKSVCVNGKLWNTHNMHFHFIEKIEFLHKIKWHECKFSHEMTLLSYVHARNDFKLYNKKYILWMILEFSMQSTEIYYNLFYQIWSMKLQIVCLNLDEDWLHKYILRHYDNVLE